MLSVSTSTEHLLDEDHDDDIAYLLYQRAPG